MGSATDRRMPPVLPLPFHASPPTAPEASPDIARMVDRLRQMGSKSGADALRELRTAFPESPLTMRVAALDMLMRQRPGGAAYRPR